MAIHLRRNRANSCEFEVYFSYEKDFEYFFILKLYSIFQKNHLVAYSQLILREKEFTF